MQELKPSCTLGIDTHATAGSAAGRSFMFGATRAAARLLCGAAMVWSLAAQAGPQFSVFWWDSTSNVEKFEGWLGRPVEIASTFTGSDTWSSIEADHWRLGMWSQWVKAKAGRNFMLAVALFPKGVGGSLASCAAGQYDVHWRTLANNLANYGLRSAYLRLGWEMNGNWYRWSAPAGSGKEASFAGCFRRVVQVMRQAQPANQWKFVWNPTDGAGRVGTAWMEAAWPGNAYVDVVGVDLYDQSWNANTYPYPSTCDAACRLTRQQTAWRAFASNLNKLGDFAIAKGKPLAFPEWGVGNFSHGHGGGDNPYFIQKMHEFIANPANNVVFHSYLNVRIKDGSVDCLLTAPGGNDVATPTQTQFPKSAALYKQLFGSSVQKGPTGVTFTAPAAGAPPPQPKNESVVPAPAPVPSAPLPPQPSRSNISYDQLWNTIKSANPLIDDDSLRTIVDSKWNDMQ